MHRIGLLRALGAIVLLGTAVAFRPPLAAQEATPPPAARPAVQADVSIESIKPGPDMGGAPARRLLVAVRNAGNQPVGPFVIELSADRQEASRPPQTSPLISLGPNQSQTLEFAAIGCKWLAAATGATLTATTNPNPVPNEAGPSANNTLTVAPNLEFPGQPACGRAPAVTPAAGAPSIVGTWQVVVTAPGVPPSPSLVTFTADGALLVADVPVQPLAPGRVAVVSPGQGVWTAGAPAAFTFAEVLTATNGTVVGTNWIRGTVTLGADGQTISGPFQYAVVVPSGRTAARGQGRFVGKRITVLPLGTPLAGAGMATPSVP
jgi:hypothetical protein